MAPLRRKSGGAITPETKRLLYAGNSHQWRTARAAILLMGDSGLRRDEAAHARREALRPYVGQSDRPSPEGSNDTPVWALTVIEKRRKQRTVPVSAATVAALRDHWIDRERDFDVPLDSAPLIAPLAIPATPSALNKHCGAVEAAYTADAFGHLVRQALQRLTTELAARPGVSPADLVQLANTSAHAFRHTFGTRAVARDMPIDVVQIARASGGEPVASERPLSGTHVGSSAHPHFAKQKSITVNAVRIITSKSERRSEPAS